MVCTIMFKVCGRYDYIYNKNVQNCLGFFFSSDEDVKKYKKTLEEKENMDRGETPPPLTSPMHRDEQVRLW